MAINQWRGDAQDVSQISTFTVAGTPAGGDTISVTTNRKVVTYTLIGGDTAITAAAALYALVSASAIAEIQEVSWSYIVGAALFTGSSQTAGVPFTITASATGTTTITAATPTAATGHNNYDEPKNWSLGTAPTGADDVVIDGGSDLLYGAGTIAGLTIDIRGTFINGMGLPERNALNYYEYRNRYITLNSATVKIGSGTGAGSSRLFVKSIAASTWTVFKTSQRETDKTPAVDIDMTGNPTLINISGGDVGLCVANEGTARTVASVGVSQSTARLTVGKSVTVTALDQDDGQSDVWGTVTTATIGLGTYNQWAGTLTNITAYAGYARLNHSGTVASVIFRGQGKDNAPPVCDMTGNNLARVFTNSEFTGGAPILDPNKTVTFTNPYLTDSASFAASNIGPRFSVQRS